MKDSLIIQVRRCSDPALPWKATVEVDAYDMDCEKKYFYGESADVTLSKVLTWLLKECIKA